MRLFMTAAELSDASLISFVRKTVMLEQEEKTAQSTRQNSRKRNFIETPLNS
jgi:hypothetical protein